MLCVREQGNVGPFILIFQIAVQAGTDDTAKINSKHI